MNSALRFLLPCLLLAAPAAAQPLQELLPQPRRVELLSGRTAAPDPERQLRIRMDAPADWDDERYELTVGPRRIEIRAKTAQGVVWARRTLAQLRDGDGRYPHVRIEDWPEFPMRGFLYDDGRNFAGTELIKHYLDLLSAYKVNLFQWHLTDKPAWRIECRCHPQLNDPRYQRPGRDTGRFYTYDEIRDVIAYARERGILIVPELDMPGHSDYFDAAFGFSMDSERGRAVLEECIAEFCAEIPAELCPYIHIGSDEVHIADPEGFMRWAQQTLRSHGRETFVWDPGLPADSRSIRQYWRDGGGEGPELPTDTRYVDSAMGYANYYDPLLFPAKMYFHTPCGEGVRSPAALGGILCMWNDVRSDDKSRIELHNGMASAVLVFAERFWNGGCTAEGRPGTLLPAPDTEAARAFEAFQRKMQAHKRRFLAREMRHWEPIRASEWRITLTADSITRTVTAWGDVIDLDALCRRHGIPDRLPVVCRAVRTIDSPSDTTRRFKIGFDAPARSDRISDGIAAQGQWPNGGCVTVNGRQLPPPRWQEPGAYRFHYHSWARPEEELLYTDEQLYWMGDPQPVRLRQGENTVEITLRKHFPGQRFEFAFVESEGGL